jgi:hypothetical protein
LVQPERSEVIRSAEALMLWESCVPIEKDHEVLSWMVACDIDPDSVGPNMARALPRNIRLPQWACYGTQPWNAAGWRLILPLYNARGRMESVYARALRPIMLGTIRTGQSFPVVDGAAGKIMANEIGLRLLERASWPGDSSWRTVILTGGAVDFLEWSSAVRGQGPAVLGIVPGSWTEQVASRIPDGTRIVVRAHKNPIAGRYAHRVQEALASRCEVIVRTAS